MDTSLMLPVYWVDPFTDRPFGGTHEFELRDNRASHRGKSYVLLQGELKQPK